MLRNIKIIKNNYGLSLLEIIVSVGIFSVVVLSATQIFRYVIIGQRNAIAAQSLQESMRYAFETMGKEIRMAVVSDGACASKISSNPTPDKKIFNETTEAEDDILYFKNESGQCVVYYLQDGALMIARGDEIGSAISNRVIIKNLKFEILDEQIGAPHTLQPRVTMRMSIEAKGDELNKQAMELQTTVSSRLYE